MRIQVQPYNEMPNPNRFVPPSIEEALLHAAKIMLPESEAHKWHCYYESNGWRVGRNPMKVWRAAMAHWKIVWQERTGGRVAEPTAPKGLSGMERYNATKEYETVLAKMKSISGSYESHQSWTKEDREKWEVLKKRKIELKNRLDIQI